MPDHDFTPIFRAELAEICRRESLATNTAKAAALREASKSGKPSAKLELTGLALSGGGVRSTAICLGVLQALATRQVNVLDRIDYLSTVSGGGYIGAALSARLANNGGRFPFESKLGEEENEDLRHIRDFSNYLLSGKPASILASFGAIVAGIFASILVVLPIILLFAALTIILNPTRAHLDHRFRGLIQIPESLSSPFALTFAGILATFVIGVLLLYVAAPFWQKGARVREGLRWAWIALAGVPLIIAFLELQPYVIKTYWSALDEPKGLSGWMAVNIFPILTAAGGVLTTISGLIGKLLGDESGKSRLWAALAGVRNALLYLAIGLVVPLLIWVSYLVISRWGIASMAGELATLCPAEGRYANPFGAPAWLDPFFCEIARRFGRVDAIGLFYASLGAVGMLAWLWIPVNAYSLHSLYRDRVSRAFLTVPEARPLLAQLGRMLMRLPLVGRAATAMGLSAPPRTGDQSQMTLTALSSEHGPYHLLNAALNILGSAEANRRGRNAEFFFFSKRFVGSKLTGWCPTEKLQEAAPLLDLGTAMTTSGAAVSANVGARFNRLLVFSLAILNIRLGYWLPNPRHCAASPSSAGGLVEAGKRWGPFWFLAESFGWLTEESRLVFLTDGGHIENLGIYELLRRRCRVIVVVDAAGDQAMVMPAFVEVQRFARIDLGIIIEMEWDLISSATTEFDPKVPRKGPHAALGLIRYEDDPSGKEGEKGLLVYIKSSLTGDENDYIRDYRRRYPAFPHESTLDQFFSEEQFEDYRALGFHMAYRLFSGEDQVQAPSAPSVGRRRFLAFARLVLRRELGCTKRLKPVYRPPTP